VSLIDRWLARPRLRSARQKLAEESSARNYLALAQEHARLGEMLDVQRVCDEGLSLFPGHVELGRLHERARALVSEDRTRALTRELREAPRPGLFRELAELLLSMGRIERAEEVAAEWFAHCGEGAAQLMRARARYQRYLVDRRREDAKLVLELCDAAEKLLPRDEAPLRLRLELCSAIGAWRDARRAVSQLLEQAPGDSVLEARFRALNGLVDHAPTIDVALRDVERSGKLVSEERARRPVVSAGGPTRSIRPLLKELAGGPNVQAAIFERGATALVQGPKGATAERTARAVREIVQKSRSTARRLGAGAPQSIEIEGDFGCVMIAPDEAGSAALWSTRSSLTAAQRQALFELVGAGLDEGGEEPAPAAESNQ
jgi:tetratricopeptide (TPR) repeat protein